MRELKWCHSALDRNLVRCIPNSENDMTKFHAESRICKFCAYTKNTCIQLCALLHICQHRQLF